MMLKYGMVTRANVALRYKISYKGSRLVASAFFQFVRISCRRKLNENLAFKMS